VAAQLWNRTRDYRISELGAEIDSFLTSAFREVWVVGSIQRLKSHSNGHTYFELVEKGPRDELVGRLDAVVWRGDRWRIDAELRKSHVELAENIEARCLITVGFWAPSGRLQASVRAIDPLFALGALEKRRREVREQLVRLGITNNNRALALGPVPTRIGLVASGDSAAYHDLLASLRASGYAFAVTHFDTRVQGARAERELVRAIETLGARGDLDCLAIVRGGGARGDLASFDALAVVAAIARCPIPVLTGLGHETDGTIADEVAWRTCHTPTRVAEVLVTAVERSAEGLRERAARLAHSGSRAVAKAKLRLARARARLAPADRRLGRADALLGRRIERLVGLANQRLGSAGANLDRHHQGLAASTRRRLEAASARLSQVQGQLGGTTLHRLETAASRLATAERLTRELGPQRWLVRGLSITRTTSGDIVRHVGQLSCGERVITTLNAGQFTARVEEIET
jgi:exodeoxyribonuclease VII large subunit